MGLLFDSIKALSGLKKIKTGGTAKLSLSQITNLIINLPDAKKNLTPEQYEKVYSLYEEMSTCKTKLLLDAEGYMDTAAEIIRRFDEIAPYEKYSGGNETEFSFMMNDLRKSSDPLEVHLKILKAEIDADIESQNYIRSIVSQICNLGFGGLVCNIDDIAYDMMVVILSFHHFGKKEALQRFDILANKLMEQNNMFVAVGAISFFAGLLCPNGVLTKEESDELSEKYRDIVFKKVEENPNNLKPIEWEMK